MGTGYHGNFGNTKGKVEHEKNILINELEKHGIKFNKEEIIFIVKDQTGQIVWLESGNKYAGLEHIINGNGISKGHALDFENAFGITKDKIPDYLYKVISCGQVISNNLVKKGDKYGFNRVYYYEGDYCVVTGIGTNGFIVSAFPKKIKEE